MARDLDSSLTALLTNGMLAALDSAIEVERTDDLLIEAFVALAEYRDYGEAMREYGRGFEPSGSAMTIDGLLRSLAREVLKRRPVRGETEGEIALARWLARYA